MPDQEFEVVKVEVDRNACIGAASCIAIAPDTFELDGEAKSVLKNVHGNPGQDVMDAAKSCPTKAIKVFGKDGKQLYP